MVLASSNNAAVYASLESVIGTPETAGFVRQRIVNDTVSRSRTQVQSAEIAFDRMSLGGINVSQTITGNINYELSYAGQEYIDTLSNAPATAVGTYTPWLSAALQANADQRQGVTGGPITAVVDIRRITYNAQSGVNSQTNTVVAAVAEPGFIDDAVPALFIQFPAGSNATLLFSQGIWGALTGAEIATCPFRVHDVIDADSMVVDSCRMTDVQIAQILALPAVQVIRAGLIQNGSTPYGFTLLKHFQVGAGGTSTDAMTRIAGVQVDTMSLTHSVGAISSGSFGVVGGSQETFNSVTGLNTPALLLGADPTEEVRSNTAFNPGPRAVVVIGRRTGICATQATITAGNNLRNVDCIGGTTEGVVGQMVSGGTVSALLDDGQITSELIREDREEDSNFAVVFQDAQRRTYIAEVPRMSYGDGAALNIPGSNQEVPIGLNFVGKRHPGYGRDYTDALGLGPSIVRVWYLGV